MTTVAHIGGGDWHDLVLLGAAVLGPVILLAIVLAWGKLRGEDDEDEDEEPIG